LDDDRYIEKLDLLRNERIPVVSFTFGCPSREDVERLHRADAAVWVTVTTPEEAGAASAAGADALIVQGVEAGGHRGGFDDRAPGDVGLLALLQLVRAKVSDALPLVGHRRRSDSSCRRRRPRGRRRGRPAWHGVHALPRSGDRTCASRCARARRRPTALTRAFTGRTARGIVNRFMREHSAAPSADPEVHHLTAPMRAAARQRGDADGFNLWAGQGYQLAESVPAAELVDKLAEQARAALTAATQRLHRPV
jgi:nitronate monooxygenase